MTLSAAALLRALTVALSAVLAAVVRRRRAQAGAAAFALLPLGVGGWALCAFLERAVVPRRSALALAGAPRLDKPFDAARVRRLVQQVRRRP